MVLTIKKTKNNSLGGPERLKLLKIYNWLGKMLSEHQGAFARVHMSTLVMSDSSLRRIHYEDTLFHCYKLMLIQELSATD